MRVGLLALAALAALAGSANAAVISFTTSTPISLTTTDWVNSLTFQKFDSTLGTLQSVELKLNGSLSTVLTITNNSLSSSSGTANTEVRMTVQDGGANLVVPTLDLIGPAYSYGLAGGGSVISGTLTKNGSSDELYTAAAVLTEFQTAGSGTITLPAGTFTQTLLANTGGNTDASQVTSASLTGDVLYTYTPVPEPASLLVLGVSLGGLMLRRRRA